MYRTPGIPFAGRVRRMLTGDAQLRTWSAGLLRMSGLLSGLLCVLLWGVLQIGTQIRGEQVAYVSYELRERGIDAEIMIRDIGRGIVYNLTDTPAVDVSPVWSPDGAYIAFISNRTGSAQVYVAEASGRQVWRVSAQDGKHHSSPLWSDDGMRLFFAQGNPGNQALYSVGRDGSALELLNQEQTQEVSLLLDVSQTASRNRISSPDGRKTLFVAFRDQHWGIYSGEDTGTAPLLASLGKTYSELPIWSADGVWVAFIAEDNGQRDVYVMRSDGSQLQRMTHTKAFDGQVRWRP